MPKDIDKKEGKKVLPINPGKTFGEVAKEVAKELGEKAQKPAAAAPEGETPVIPEFFGRYNYRLHMRNEPLEPSVVLQKSNMEAARIWGTPEVFQNLKRIKDADRYGYRDSYMDAGNSPDPVVVANNEYYDMERFPQVLLSFYNISVQPTLGGFHYGRSVNHNVTRLIEKIAALEDKYEDEDIVNSDARKVIIDQALMPATEVIGVNSWANPTVWLPYDKSSVLSQEEQNLLSAIVSYLPKIRHFNTLKVLDSAENTIGTISRKDSIPNDFDKHYRYTTGSVELRHVADKVDRLSEFLGIAIPYDISDNLIFIRDDSQYNGRNTAVAEVYKASTKLREIAVKYVQYKKTLSELLQAISDFAEATLLHQQSKCDIVASYFQYFNRAGILFEEVLNEGKHAYIRQQNEPPF